MDRLARLSEYIRIYRDRHPGGTSREAREWMEQTPVSAADAGTLARKGYTPAVAVAQIEAAPVRYDDERDAEAAIDAMLYGPDAS